MSEIIRVNATDGTPIEYVNDIIGKESNRLVYHTPDKSSVVVFYKQHDIKTKDRLENIVGKYNPCNDPIYGEYWRNLFCWPEKLIDEGKLGFVIPGYPKQFFFKTGPMKGQAKEGKWFASVKLRKILDSSEKGDWLSYFKICIKISRAVAKMHTSGLAHSDLSFRSFLVDPKGGNAIIINIFDELIVPGKYPPDVLGTADFIAPEIYQTRNLDVNDPKRVLPSIKTNLHALATLIYMYLLYRHPLRGKKVHDLDPSKDEEMLLGGKALFIEHPQDKSNRPPQKIEAMYLPWADVSQISYSVTGTYLKSLFENAFITGLHDPSKRPMAHDWEHALIKTIDLLYPCGNPQCEQKWFVLEDHFLTKCPFCNWEEKKSVPLISFYSQVADKQYKTDNHQLTVYNGLYLYPWHIDKTLFPDEKLSAKNKKPVGYFSYHKNKWIFINQNISNLIDLNSNKRIALNSAVELSHGKQICINYGSSHRLLIFNMESCRQI